MASSLAASSCSAVASGSVKRLEAMVRGGSPQNRAAQIPKQRESAVRPMQRAVSSELVSPVPCRSRTLSVVMLSSMIESVPAICDENRSKACVALNSALRTPNEPSKHQLPQLIRLGPFHVDRVGVQRTLGGNGVHDRLVDEDALLIVAGAVVELPVAGADTPARTGLSTPSQTRGDPARPENEAKSLLRSESVFCSTITPRSRIFGLRYTASTPATNPQPHSLQQVAQGLQPDRPPQSP